MWLGWCVGGFDFAVVLPFLAMPGLCCFLRVTHIGMLNLWVSILWGSSRLGARDAISFYIYIYIYIRNGPTVQLIAHVNA